MRRLEIAAPKGASDKVEEVLEEHDADPLRTEAVLENENAYSYRLSVESDEIDEIVESLRSVEGVETGKLRIDVLEQKSRIEKGRETEGSATDLSQQEIYAKAQEFSGFDSADWGLMAVSAAVTAFGLMTGNLVVLIGAMMFAPLLSPMVAASVSMVLGDSNLMRSSVRTAAVSGFLTVAIAALVSLPFSTGASIPSIYLRPEPLTVATAVLVGCAASLTSATGRRDQVAGVAVAIALVPPLAGTGVELAAGNLEAAISAATVAAINGLGVLAAGTATFLALGLKPETYYKQIRARRMLKLLPALLLLLLAVLLAVRFWPF